MHVRLCISPSDNMPRGADTADDDIAEAEEGEEVCLISRRVLQSLARQPGAHL